MKNNIYDVKNRCTGCGLCSVQCPFDAIKMEEDKEGFLYPVIDYNKCKKCGICLKKCPANDQISSIEDDYKKKAYMVLNKDLEEYRASSSGGFATALSRFIIKKFNGVVYGVTLNEKYEVKHVKIEKEEDIKKIQGSKYVQSNIIEVYNQILKDLNTKKVLFIGTPCQVDSIKRYTKNNKNLITCDIVCHGVASPKFFKIYLEYLSKKFKDKIIDFKFRNKCDYDETGFVEKIAFEDRKEKKIIADYDLFYSDYIKDNNHRYNCYSCKYKKEERMGDFTIGDVASWEEYYDFYPEKALSLVIVNNSKANKLFNGMKEMIDIKEIDLDKEKVLNKALMTKSSIPYERNKIYEQYNNFELYENKVLKSIPFNKKVKIFIKKILPYSMRIKIKKIKKGYKNEC